MGKEEIRKPRASRREGNQIRSLSIKLEILKANKLSGTYEEQQDVSVAGREQAKRRVV